MPADAQIRITAENQTPQAFRQVDQSLKSLDQQTRAVHPQHASRLLLWVCSMPMKPSKRAVGVTNLGRAIFKEFLQSETIWGRVPRPERTATRGEWNIRENQ